VTAGAGSTLIHASTTTPAATWSCSMATRRPRPVCPPRPAP